MNISYASRSSFTGICEDGITRHLHNLNNGLPVHIRLKPGGYAGCIEVTINANDTASFGTNWVSTDPTRFPARIKAAATALFRCRCVGRFEISHDDGIIIIKRI